MKRDDFQFAMDRDPHHELVIDNFAGGGGTSTGLEAAFNRPVDIAINHNAEALAMHALNHPYTKHMCESVWDIDPMEVTRGRPVALVWLSPDCRHFSKAKGGKPVSKDIRGLAWVTLRWCLDSNPRVIALENVEEFVTWCELIEVAPGKWIPDPAKKGQTFNSFVGMLSTGVSPDDPALLEACEALKIDPDGPAAKRLVAGLGYHVEYQELRACDNGAPTLRNRFFLVARRDGLPPAFPAQTHAEPKSAAVLSGTCEPHRTAAEIIDFGIEAQSIFDRKKPLVYNTHRRVAKGLWRHVLASDEPFIVPSNNSNARDDAALATPFITEHANASNQRTMRPDEPLRTTCAQVKGGHFSVVAPSMVQLRGTSEAHLNANSSLKDPLSAISAGGTHHALTSAHLITIGYGERPGQEPRTQPITRPLGTSVAGGIKQALVAAHVTKFRTGSIGVPLSRPMPTVTANSFQKRPGGNAPLGLVAAHLMHLTHHGDRPGTTPSHPLPTVTGAHRGEQALAAAFFEQANGGFWEDNDGRSAMAPLSTIASKGANQRLVTAYLVKCGVAPARTRSARDSNLVTKMLVPAKSLPEQYRDKAQKCAALLHEHLPEHFPEQVDMVLMTYDGAYWVLVDITLRMLKARELFRGQSFPDTYIIDEIPDPKLLFKNGIQVHVDPRTIPRIRLSITAQVRMVGNSVAPVQAEALIRANFPHEPLISHAAA